MLDTTTLFEPDTTAWRDTLRYGDVVLFRFPLAEGRSDRHLKARPCLVLDTETVAGIPYAVIAYGTTSRRKSNVGEEVHVRRRDAYTAAGLNEPTRFVGARRILVPLTHSGFVDVAVTGSPVIGRLGEAEIERLNEVRGRIHALRDIAAERQQHRRRRTNLGLQRPRGVTVRHDDREQPVLRKGATQ